MALSSGGCFSNSHRGSRGALATHTEEAVRLGVIWSVRGAASEILEFTGYGEGMSVICRHIKEQFGQGPSKAKL